jgi:predicted dehydrogenase
MEKNAKIRLLAIGLGNMGNVHVKNCAGSANIELAGICDNSQDLIDRSLAIAGTIPVFTDFRKAMDELKPDAVLVATPHYSHPELAIEAFKRGIHVLVEKPIGVHAKDARRMVTAWQEAKKKKNDLVFAAMFQQRTLGHWRKVKSLIDDGELGKLVRATWIITDWFRTQTYYDSGDWRATWSGEGGGVLLNQCPHNLDLYRWFFGLPSRVHGHCAIGKYHDIEVEDEVTAFFEYDNGMVGHFITSTGEAPGTNRLEIVGEHGKLVYENGELLFQRNRTSMLVHLRESKETFARPESWDIKIPFEPSPEAGHRIVLENFAAAIQSGTPLIAPASDGIDAVMLGNAILYSSLEKKPVDMPMDEEAYALKLADLAKGSRYTKKTPSAGTLASDFSKSF